MILMGKYMRKCKGIREISVMEVVAHGGVRTRARALAMAAAPMSSGTAKRRKLGGGTGEMKKLSASLVQLRSRRRVVIKSQNLVSPTTSSSCCSSNNTLTDLVEDRLKTVDLEEVEEDDDIVQIKTSMCDLDCRERSRKTTASMELQAESGDLESTVVRQSEANSRRRLSAENMPSQTELEEFFTAAEKDLHKRFTEKYNYDVVKDVPLEGRYEWVRVKP